MIGFLRNFVNRKRQERAMEDYMRIEYRNEYNMKANQSKSVVPDYLQYMKVDR